MDKCTTKITLAEYFIPLDPNFLSSLLKKYDLDRYTKKFDSIAAMKLFIFAQLMQIKHYVDISQKLNNNRKLQKTIGLSSISTSQLCRKWRNIDHKVLEQVYRQLVQQVISRFGVAKANAKLGMIHMVDSTTITLCLNQHRWATYSKHKGAIRVHTRFNRNSDVGFPDEVLLTSGSVADRTLMDDLVVVEEGALNVFDRGYVDYEKFDAYCKQSVRFITRLRHNASYKVLEEREVKPNTNGLKDAVILLGYRTCKRMENNVRLIQCKEDSGEEMLICTNDFDTPAEEIREIYRRRWKIEMFFKWIKQHLHVKNFYGRSPNAVYNQIYAALIAFCLTLLMQANVHHKGTMLELVKQIRLSWDDRFQRFLQALFPPPGRTSKGRRRQKDAELVYAETCQQVADGEADYLDEMSQEFLM
ncbi:IS4 family transposase [Mycobacterium gordonae]|uniref:IS4 family transposase n=1 Tax=Mycobacterium gordonae TaxID=1778 RepID=UPI00210E3B64|nr:IS4 family transposase [Mycobacterium gordonae]MCQ4365957.1 IS4 family transposase [Mycobacterium gordonae]